MTGNGRYGNFRYGVYEYQPPDTPGTDQPLPDREVTPEEAFGRGIALKPADSEGVAWDIAVTPGGDFAVTSGWQEIGKDIAFEVAKSGVRLVGALNDADARTSLEMDIRRLVRRDPRVESIHRLEISAGDSPSTVRIRVRFTAASGELHDVVIPVSRPPGGSGGSTTVQEEAETGSQEQS